MTKDVCVTRTGKSVEQTTIAQIDMGAASYQAVEAAAVDKLTLGQVFTHLVFLRLAFYQTMHGDVGAVLLIVISRSVVLWHTIGVTHALANSSFLSTAEYLEYVATVQVDAGVAPDF